MVSSPDAVLKALADPQRVPFNGFAGGSYANAQLLVPTVANKPIQLRDNFRCATTVLSAAEAIAVHMPRLHSTVLSHEGAPSGEVRLLELASVIEDNYSKQEIKDLISQISVDPENLDEIITKHFDDVVIKYVREVTIKSRKRFLKTLYQCLSEFLFERTATKGISENLRNWFGDSKIKDANGNPLPEPCHL